MVATYRVFNLANHDRLARPFPGISDLLGDLRARGARLGVVTSKGRSICERGLATCELAWHFEAIVTSDDVQEHKPMPGPVTEALRRLDADPEATVFIGDSPHDVTSGHAAGVATGAALWGPYSAMLLERCRPTFRLASPRDVLSIARPDRACA
jgi:pyrophosphatase PpaX